MQLWHVGRVSHVDLQPGSHAPVAPSAIGAQTKTFVNNSFENVSEPRALALDELPAIINDFRQPAANAITAGFDDVEVHGANGYLLEQFIKDGANGRTHAYGGSIENRARLLLEVTAVVVEEIGAQRTDVRISPVTPASGISCSDPISAWTTLPNATRQQADYPEVMMSPALPCPTLHIEAPNRLIKVAGVDFGRR